MKKKIIAITIIFGLTGLSGCVESVKLDKDQERQFVNTQYIRFLNMIRII